MKCITNAWDLYENELRGYLHSKLNDHHLVEDLLQDVFVKALAESSKFCHLENTRAWLFRVTKNHLIDFIRTHKNHDEIPDDLPSFITSPEPVVQLSKCLPVALKKLSSDDKEIIELCDLDGMNQADFAQHKQLSTAASKSRIQRARKRLKKELHIVCKIELDTQGNVCCFIPCCK